MPTVVQVVVTGAFFAVFALTLPPTRPGIACWLASLFALVWLTLQPGQAPRLVAFGIWLAWIVLDQLGDRVPLLAWGTAAERRCQAVILRCSRAAREAYLAGRLDVVVAGLVADLEALEAPPGPWQAVRAAQLLDLRADPPQVGVGDATERLAPWPWRVALDRRTVQFQTRIRDAVRGRRARRLALPGFDELPSDRQYDSYFLRILAARFKRLADADGGLVHAEPEAAALIALGREVAAPDAAWGRLRDLVVERLGLELRAATQGLDPAAQDRLRIVDEEVFARWSQLEEPFTRGATAKR